MDKASSERGGYSIMELNIVATGIELVGTTIKEIIIEQLNLQGVEIPVSTPQKGVRIMRHSDGTTLKIAK